MTIPAVVFIAYFSVVFFIGWRALKATRNEEDYWIAGGNLGWLLGGGTLAATHASAGTFIGVIGIMYTVGWSFAWIVLTIPAAYWFVAAVLAPRFTRVRELTLPAFMQTRYYSKNVRALAAVIILIATTVYIQAQIVSGGLIANTLFGIPTKWGMLGFTLVLLAYTVVGGMIAVVYTDLIQMVIMVVGTSIAVPLAVRQAGGMGTLLEHVVAVNPAQFEWGALPTALLFTMSIAFMLGSVATPEKLIRLYAMKDMPTIRRGILMAIVVATGLNILVMILSLVAVVLFPNLPTGDLAMPMIARAVLPGVLGAVLLAAVTAAMMSTVDSLLIVAGSALSFDIYKTLVNPDASPERSMWVDRLGVIVVGTVPVVLLLFGVGEGELVQLIVLLFTALMAASFFMPVVGGVLWRRATKEGAAAAMIGGVVATFAWKAWGWPNIDPVVPGFLASAALFVVVSLLTPPPPSEATEPYFGASAQG